MLRTGGPVTLRAGRCDATSDQAFEALDDNLSGLIASGSSQKNPPAISANYRRPKSVRESLCVAASRGSESPFILPFQLEAADDGGLS